MSHDKTIEHLGKSTLSRREMVKVLASVSIGLIASPLMSGPVIAGEIREQNATRMVAAIFFESYATLALRRAAVPAR